MKDKVYILNHDQTIKSKVKSVAQTLLQMDEDQFELEQVGSDKKVKIIEKNHQ